MIDELYITSTRLQQKGKRGILKPDSDGYYTMPVGGLEVSNTSGIFYTSGCGVKELFTDPNGLLQQRLRNGTLKGENGHPKKKPGESEEHFTSRAMYVDEANTVVFFREIWLDLEFGKKNPEYGNPNLIAIMATFKPDGEKGHLLKAALEDPHQNVCFSIRSLAENIRTSTRKIRAIREIMTFDFVTEPGIAFATKWDAPALESATGSRVERKWLERIVAANDDDNRPLVANENSRLLARSMLSKWAPSTGTLGFQDW